jgi:predicted MFS family arabinose efflux permease
VGRQSIRPAWSSLVLLLGLAGLIVMADNWVVSPILPSIARDMSVSPARAGILIAAYMLPFGLFQLVFGPLADRFGKMRIVLGTVAVFAVVTSLGGLMTTLGGLTGVRAFTGVFAAATMPVSLALIGDLVPLSERQRAIGTFMGIAFLGQGLSMAVGGSIAALLSWRAVFFLYGAIALVVAGVLAARGRHVSAERWKRGPVWAPYRSLLGRWASLRVYLVVFFEGMLILGTFSYLGALLSQRHGLGPLAIGLVMTAFGVAAVLFGRLSGRLAAKLGGANLIFLALALGGLAAFLLLWAPILPLETAAVFALGASFMLAHSTLLTLATELAAQQRGVAMSLVAFAFMGGGSLGTMLGGRLVAAFGFSAFLLVGGAGLVVLALAARVVFAHLATPTAKAIPGTVSV